ASPDDGGHGAEAAGSIGLAVSPSAVQRRLGEAVRMHAKVRGLHTIKDLAGLAGEPINRMRKLASDNPDDQRAPSAAELLSLCAVMGPAETSLILSLIGMSAADEEDLEVDPLGKMAADLMGEVATLARVASDGKVNPHEVNMTEEATDAIIESALKFKAAARQAKGRG
ncbi:hypothetical protein, partial [Polymorphobacter multimanifer]|uniref:hypothetical protein n=1 Tax=Polymorphobacter multimanifer TaxID=1070431 RepID=UPI001A9C44D1